MVAAPARFAAVHERVLTPYELALLQPHRRRLLSRARGTVLDLGGGTGAHFGWYPPGVERVVVLGADPLVRPVVARRAAKAAVPVELVERVEDAGLADGDVDAVVAQLVLCANADVDATLAMAGRLLADDGLLLALEHVPPRGAPNLLRRAARPLWRTVAAGCDLARDLTPAVRRAGLLPIEIQRFSVQTLTLPLRTCATVVARHPRWSGR